MTLKRMSDLYEGSNLHFSFYYYLLIIRYFEAKFEQLPNTLLVVLAHPLALFICLYLFHSRFFPLSPRARCRSRGRCWRTAGAGSGSPPEAAGGREGREGGAGADGRQGRLSQSRLRPSSPVPFRSLAAGGREVLPRQLRPAPRARLRSAFSGPRPCARAPTLGRAGPAPLAIGRAAVAPWACGPPIGPARCQSARGCVRAGCAAPFPAVCGAGAGPVRAGPRLARPSLRWRRRRRRPWRGSRAGSSSTS